jgi:prevent-host-death family protein
MRWQVQEAKQRFSEVVRLAGSEGPQVVTRHGRDVVVVLDVGEFERLTGGSADFKAFLATAPDIGALEIERSTEPARVAELGDA